MMFHPSGTICAQNVRFYTEATLSVHGKIILPVCCFPPFPQLFAFPYIYFRLTFLLVCRFSPKWDHLCPRYFEMICFTQVGPSVPKIFRDDFLTRMGPSVPKIFRDDFSREWDHLCPRYLGLMFYPSGTICAQKVRFYIEATIIVHGEIMLPVFCFPPFSQLFAFAYIYIYIYIYIYLTCSFFCFLVGFPPSRNICARDTYG